MPDKLVVFNTSALSLAHLGLELEIIEELKKEYNEIEIIKCNSKLPSCYLNPTHNIIACAICQARTDRIINSNQINITNSFPKVSSKKVSINKNTLNSIDNLMDLSYKGIDYGRGIASSLVSIYRNSKLNLEPLRELISIWAGANIALIDKLPQFLKHKPDVLIFNGRFYEIYPIKVYCELENINYYTHEKGTNFSKYQLIKNSTVHSLKTRDIYMRKIWREADSDKRQIASDWFKAKKYSTITTETNFTGNQDKGRLPTSFDIKKENIIIFNSSEDEFKSIKEWNHSLYISQNELILRLVKHFKDQTNIHFTVRFHPNLANIAQSQLDELYASKVSNMTIVAPEQKIDSYALLDAADKVLSFGSRMSIEASYWRIPSITYGKSFYNSLESLYVPKDFKELVSLISHKNLPTKNIEDNLMAAYFLLERGNKSKYLKVKSKHRVFYKGETIRVDYLSLVKNLLKNVRLTSLWAKTYYWVKNKTFKKSL